VTDIVSKEVRSRMMSGIKGKNTKPEMIVRSTLHKLGYRFRLHSRILPGKPDIVLAMHKTVIFVHGCFWHRHEGCRYAYTPKSRESFWKEKFSKNVDRDQRNVMQLQHAGWKVAVIWECETVNLNTLSTRLKLLLSSAD